PYTAVEGKLHGNYGLLSQKRSVGVIQVLPREPYPEHSAIYQKACTEIEIPGISKAPHYRVVGRHVAVRVERELISENQFVVVDTPEADTKVEAGGKHHLAVKIHLVRILEIHDGGLEVGRPRAVCHHHEPQPTVEVGEIVIVADCVGNEPRSEEHTSELQSRENLVCRLLLEKKKTKRHETKLSI